MECRLSLSSLEERRECVIILSAIVGVGIIVVCVVEIYSV